MTDVKVEYCEECNQSALFGLVQFGNKRICTQCHKNYLSAGGDIIEMYIDETSETIYLPLAENLESEGYESTEELLTKWGLSDWGFHNKVDVKVIPKDLLLQEYPNINLQDIVKCNEFWGVYCFRDLAIKSHLYDTPWDAVPEDAYYSCLFALYCNKGEIYSKDFAYFDCPDCGRTICEQNPANGWMTQYRYINDEQVCLSCLQKKTLVTGILIEEDTTFKEATAYAMFYNYNELSENGWINEGDYKDEYIDWNKVKQLAKTNYILINIDRSAIGGLEYYWSLYIKTKKNES